MLLREYLRNITSETSLVYFDNHFYRINSITKLRNIEFCIDDDLFIIYDRNWSKIILNNNYEKKKFNNLIKICDAINQHKKISFCVFEDSVKVNDALVSTLDFFTNFEHPIKKWKFHPNQPNFPFTTDRELMASNIYYFYKFCDRMKYLLRYQTVTDLVEFVNIRVKRKCDFIEILKKDFSYIESDLGILIDKFCLEGPDYNYSFCLKFLPLIEKCLKKIDFLPSQYIKIY